jgi:hypothetical protein
MRATALLTLPPARNKGRNEKSRRVGSSTACCGDLKEPASALLMWAEVVLALAIGVGDKRGLPLDADHGGRPARIARLETLSC